MSAQSLIFRKWQATSLDQMGEELIISSEPNFGIGIVQLQRNSVPVLPPLGNGYPVSNQRATTLRNQNANLTLVCTAALIPIVAL